jgi:hypothetical protein
MKEKLEQNVNYIPNVVRKIIEESILPFFQKQEEENKTQFNTLNQNMVNSFSNLYEYLCGIINVNFNAIKIDFENLHNENQEIKVTALK